MRYVVLAVMLLALVGAGVVAGIVYFDLSITLAGIRDAVIIVYGAVGVLFFLLGIVAIVALLAALRAASDATGGVFNESVRPAANDAREMVDDVRGMVKTARGGVEFVTDSAVSPVIRAVAVARGVRRGFENVARGRRTGGG